MKIEELKQKIESNIIDSTPIIFIIKDCSFIPNQYIHEISSLTKRPIEYITNIPTYQNIFEISEQTIKVFKTDKFQGVDANALYKQEYTYIICKEADTDLYGTICVDVPKLEDWQIMDFVYSSIEGVDSEDITNLVESCQYNIYRLEQEICKLNIFPQERRKYLFKQFIEDDIFNDVSKYNIFNFSNCIIKRDRKNISDIYAQIENIDCEPLGLLTTLINNFRNIISIQLSNNPTPESTGLKPNQFWAIKYNCCGFYNKDELTAIYTMLTGIDKKIKTGELSIDILVDYITTYILML